MAIQAADTDRWAKRIPLVTSGYLGDPPIFITEAIPTTIYGNIRLQQDGSG
jgi:hypothetical protein